ncbi:hypothetical protein HPP92_002816 [Vanilla planifolia]|uniref:Uncharacterized protein n=1 Tax=Vanilla planifolia TaxID=51239 RepID=A0A835S263_VANPL|nr:hypothetical protein HPP92_002816 [Vanilla planifolia]
MAKDATLNVQSTLITKDSKIATCACYTSIYSLKTTSSRGRERYSRRWGSFGGRRSSDLRIAVATEDVGLLGGEAEGREHGGPATVGDDSYGSAAIQREVALTVEEKEIISKCTTAAPSWLANIPLCLPSRRGLLRPPLISQQGVGVRLGGLRGGEARARRRTTRRRDCGE